MRKLRLEIGSINDRIDKRLPPDAGGLCLYKMVIGGLKNLPRGMQITITDCSKETFNVFKSGIEGYLSSAEGRNYAIEITDHSYIIKKIR